MSSEALTRIRLFDLLRIARGRQASDLHLAASEHPTLRIDGYLVRLNVEPMADEELNGLQAMLLDARLSRILLQQGDADTALRDADLGVFRVHVYHSLGKPRFAIRLVPQHVPSLERMFFPPAVAGLVTKNAGLILFVGPTGSGKTTALAALVDCINRTTARHIVTIEDPVEYVHTPFCASISHREIGTDVMTFASGVRSVLRADPDVILIGELRDSDTMQAALCAAETGHLVFSTLHSGDAAQTVDRFTDAFASGRQQQIRAQLAQTLLAVISIRLVKRAASAGRRAAVEVLVGTEAVRALIRDGKSHQLRNAIVTGRQAGMQTLETHLSDLVVRRDITLECARAATDRPDEIRVLSGYAS